MKKILIFLVFISMAMNFIFCKECKKKQVKNDFKTYEEFKKFTSFKNTLKRYVTLLENFEESIDELEKIRICDLTPEFSEVVFEKKKRNYQDLLHHANKGIDYLLKKKQHLLMKYEKLRENSIFGKHPRFDFRVLEVRYTGVVPKKIDNIGERHLNLFFEYAKKGISGVLEIYIEKIKLIKENKELKTEQKNELLLPVRKEMFKLYLGQKMISKAMTILADPVFSGEKNKELKNDLSLRVNKVHQKIVYGKIKFLIRKWPILLLETDEIERNLKYYFIETKKVLPWYFKLHKPETKESRIDDVYKALFYEFENLVQDDQELYYEVERIFAEMLKSAKEKSRKASILSAISQNRSNNCNFDEAIKSCDRIISLGGCGMKTYGEMAKIPVRVRETMSFFHMKEKNPVINLPPLENKKRLEELTGYYSNLTKIDFMKKFEEQYLIARKTFTQFTDRMKKICEAPLLLQQGIFAQEAKIFGDAKKDYKRVIIFLARKKAKDSGVYKEAFFRSGIVAREKKEYKEALHKFDEIIKKWK